MIRLASKRCVFEMMLDESPTVSVTVHPGLAHPDLRLPDHLMGEPEVILVYGSGLVMPIPDLTVDVGGIGATLSFGRTPFYTFLPWETVRLLCTRHVYVLYPHKEVAIPAPPPPENAPRGGLRLVK